MRYNGPSPPLADIILFGISLLSFSSRFLKHVFQSQASSGVLARTLDLQGGGCEIPHQLERGTKYSL